MQESDQVEVMQVPNKHVGAIIGPKGANIHRLIAESGSMASPFSSHFAPVLPCFFAASPSSRCVFARSLSFALRLFAQGRTCKWIGTMPRTGSPGA